MVNETPAKRRHIAAGDHLTIVRETAAEAGPASNGRLAVTPTPVVLRVTGVVVGGGEVVQDDVGRESVVTLTPAYYGHPGRHTTALSRADPRRRTG